MLIDTADKKLNPLVMKTKHSHKCQESLRSDNSAPIHSVLRAHTTDTSLERSTSQFRFTLCSSSAESPFLSIADSAHRAMCPTLCIAVTRLDCPLPAECCFYMQLMCISNIRLSQIFFWKRLALFLFLSKLLEYQQP